MESADHLVLTHSLSLTDQLMPRTDQVKYIFFSFWHHHFLFLSLLFLPFCVLSSSVSSTYVSFPSASPSVFFSFRFVTFCRCTIIIFPFFFIPLLLALSFLFLHHQFLPLLFLPFLFRHDLFLGCSNKSISFFLFSFCFFFLFSSLLFLPFLILLLISSVLTPVLIYMAKYHILPSSHLPPFRRLL